MAITGLIADKNMNPITDPNPIDVIEDLKNLDDRTLTAYATNRQNPNATYALVVLMQRQNARDKAESEGAPVTTVAEDVSQDVVSGGITQTPPSPDQLTSMGVGSLPVSNVGQNYAAGGIVAFQDGGDVGFPSKYSELYPSLDFITTGIGDIASYLNPYSYQKVIDPVTGKIVSRVDLEGGRFADTKKVMERELREARERRQERDREKSIAQKQKEEADLATRGTVDPKLAEYQGDRSMMDLLKSDEKKAEKPTLAELEGESVFAGEEGIDPSVTPLIDEVSKEQNKGVDLTGGLDDLRKKYTEDRTTEKGVRDYVQEIEDAQAAVGLEKDMFADLRADLQRDRQQLGMSKREAADMAFIEAGLLIAGGKSPNALSNLAEAVPAVRNYANEVKGLRAEDRELKNMEFKIKSSDAAIKQGQADKALAMLESNRKMAFELDKLELTEKQKAEQEELNRQNSVRIAEITNMRPSDFDKQLAIAQKSGQYNKEDGSFDFKAFLEDLKPYGKSALATAEISREKAIIDAYAKTGGFDPVTGEPISYEQFAAQFGVGTGGGISGLTADDLALINKYSGV